MRRLFLVLFILGVLPHSVLAAIVPASVSLLRIDDQTVRLYVENVSVLSNQNLYQLFNVPTVSPFGDHVYLGPYGSPWSRIAGDFGVPTGFEGDVNLRGAGEAGGWGLNYSIDVISLPLSGYLNLELQAEQDYFYEYARPDGSVFRDLAGNLDGDLKFVGYVPTTVGARSELLVTPEPRPLALLATGLLCLYLLGRPRRSTP